MERRTNSPYPRIDRPILAIVGLLLVLSTVLFTRNDREHEWRYYQYAFRNLVAERFGAEKASQVPSGLQQIWVPALGRADRCISCHQATGWPGLESAEHPFRTHPPEIVGLSSLLSIRVAPGARLIAIEGTAQHRLPDDAEPFDWLDTETRIEDARGHLVARDRSLVRGSVWRSGAPGIAAPSSCLATLWALGTCVGRSRLLFLVLFLLLWAATWARPTRWGWC